MRFIKLIFFVLFFLVSMLFFFDNQAVLAQSFQLKLSFFSWSIHSTQLPLYIVILLAFALGCVVTACYFLIEKIRMGSLVRTYRTRVNGLEQELNTLRNMPLNEDEPAYSASSDETESAGA